MTPPERVSIIDGLHELEKLSADIRGGPLLKAACTYVAIAVVRPVTHVDDDLFAEVFSRVADNLGVCALLGSTRVDAGNTPPWSPARQLRFLQMGLSPRLDRLALTADQVDEVIARILDGASLLTEWIDIGAPLTDEELQGGAE